MATVAQVAAKETGLYWYNLHAEMIRSQELANKMASRYYVEMMYELRDAKRIEDQKAGI